MKIEKLSKKGAKIIKPFNQVPLKSLFLSILWIFSFSTNAQTVIGGSNPDPSAMLDIQSTTKGVLFPRINDRSLITNPATGLMIYNNVVGCLEINLGTPANPSWQRLNCRCGAFVAPGVWKTFMCHNLGTADFSADPFTPSWEINGGYWQWGKAVQAAEGPSDASSPNSGSVAGWSSSMAPDGSWVDSNPMTSNPADNPCPAGFRVPSKAQWEGVANNALNPRTIVGSSWTTGVSNYSNGVKFGDNLFLPAAGFREFNDGRLDNRGRRGHYWSSTQISSDITANFLIISNTSFITAAFVRTYGYSIRCMEE